MNRVNKWCPERFSIRTILWVTTLTAISLGWWVDHHRQQSQVERLQLELDLERAIAVEKAARRFTGVPDQWLPNPVPTVDALSRPTGALTPK